MSDEQYIEEEIVMTGDEYIDCVQIENDLYYVDPESDEYIQLLDEYQYCLDDGYVEDIPAGASLEVGFTGIRVDGMTFVEIVAVLLILPIGYAIKKWVDKKFS